jgi:hypothetical protein
MFSFESQYYNLYVFAASCASSCRPFWLPTKDHYAPSKHLTSRRQQQRQQEQFGGC